MVRVDWSFDRAVTVQKLGGILGADAWNTGVAVGGIAHEREQVGDERRINAKLFADSGCIANCFAPAIDLDHARIPHALRQILVRRPDGDFLHVLVPGREMGG